MTRPSVWVVSWLACLALAGCGGARGLTSSQTLAAAPEAPASDPLALAPIPNDLPEAGPSETAPEIASAEMAAVLARVRLRFDPVIGPTVEAALPLSAGLASRARERGVIMAGRDDPAATHVLKGYFSVLAEADGALIVYVWDIYDMAGARLHRVNGQQSVAPLAGEGWPAVPAATMATIAAASIDEIAAWIAQAGSASHSG